MRMHIYPALIHRCSSFRLRLGLLSDWGLRCSYPIRFRVGEEQEEFSVFEYLSLLLLISVGILLSSLESPSFSFFSLFFPSSWSFIYSKINTCCSVCFIHSFVCFDLAFILLTVSLAIPQSHKWTSSSFSLKKKAYLSLVLGSHLLYTTNGVGLVDID